MVYRCNFHIDRILNFYCAAAFGEIQGRRISDPEKVKIVVGEGYRAHGAGIHKPYIKRSLSIVE